jgi:ribosomal protein S18 acetylase RimI-like enzyme
MPLMPNEFKIRLACKDDIPIMAKLLVSLFEIEKDFIPNEDVQQRGLQLLLSGNDKGCIYVAYNGHRKNIIGMIALHLRISTAWGALCGVLEDLIVHPDYRGKGIGTMLLNTAKSQASAMGLYRLQLITDKDNRHAIEFYQGDGWKKTNLLQLHYSFS